MWRGATTHLKMRAIAIAAAAVLCAPAPAHGFEHGWTTVQDQMWGWLGGDYINAPNSSQLTWYAQNYGVVVIGGANPGPGHNMSYPGQFDIAAALKKINPTVKVLLYEASGFGALGFGQQEMKAHPEWCLTDDHGVPYDTVRNGKDCGCQEVDYRKQEVRDWFAHTANQSGEAYELFDGLMIDSAGPGSSVQYRADNHTMSDASIKVVMQAKMDMLGEATKWFKALNNGYVTGNPTLEWDVIGPHGAGRGGPFPGTYHWGYLRGTLDEMFGAFGTQDGHGEWNATLMEQSFDAIINETTVFNGGDNMVLIRGYPGPVTVPFANIPSTTPGPNPRGPNRTILVPAWPNGLKGNAAETVAAAHAPAMDLPASLARVWAQRTEVDGTGTDTCGVLQGYFYYTWPAGRGANNTVRVVKANSTGDCCGLCGKTAGCHAFSYYKHQTPGLCRLHKEPLPAVLPGPTNPQYDSGNLHGPAPTVAPGPSPGPPGPPRPPRPPPPPPPPPPLYPYDGIPFPTSTAAAKEVSAALLHEALAPYLITATSKTWFSYAWFYGVQTGWAPCPENPGACVAPDEWYPDLSKPIGKPLGPARKTGTMYTRTFEHATAFIDLSDRRKSKVTWASDVDADA